MVAGSARYITWWEKESNELYQRQYLKVLTKSRQRPSLFNHSLQHLIMNYLLSCRKNILTWRSLTAAPLKSISGNIIYSNWNMKMFRWREFANFLRCIYCLGSRKGPLR